MHERGPVQINIPRDYFYGENTFTVPTPKPLSHGAGSDASLSLAAKLIAEAKALQGVGISRQRGTIVQGLKDSIGMGGGAADATKVSELLLITQYFDTLEKLAEGKGNVTFINQGESMSDMFRNGILQTARAGGK